MSRRSISSSELDGDGVLSVIAECKLTSMEKSFNHGFKFVVKVLCPLQYYSFVLQRRSSKVYQ